MTLDVATPLRKRDSHLWARDPQDWYVEPEWCSERLFDVEPFEGPVLDPACGMGRIVQAARRAGHSALGTDLIARTDGAAVVNFLTAYPFGNWDNIVCNPPFRIAEKFVRRALELTPRKVAMLLPAAWVQGDKRSRWLETTPLARVLFIAPRPSMPPGAVIAAGEKPGNGTTDFAWFIWLRGYRGAPALGWLRRDA